MLVVELRRLHSELVLIKTGSDPSQCPNQPREKQESHSASSSLQRLRQRGGLSGVGVRLAAQASQKGFEENIHLRPVHFEVRSETNLRNQG